jgi:hypothetical protein
MQDYSQILSARGWASPAAPHTFVETADGEYHARVEAALDAICRSEYPSGMILWLERADHSLYDSLTCSLPNLISRLWNARAPLNQFERVMDEWLAVYTRACVLFVSQKTTHLPGVLG